MAGVEEDRYWCHICEEVVVPVEPEKKCPDCDGGFVEEMGSRYFEPSANSRSDGSMSLWAPLLFGMMEGSSRRSRERREMMYSDDESRRSRTRRAFRDSNDDSQRSRFRRVLRDSNGDDESPESRIRRELGDYDDESQRAMLRRALRDSDDDESRRAMIRRALRDSDDDDESRRAMLRRALRDSDDDESQESRIRTAMRDYEEEEEEEEGDDDSDGELEDLIRRRTRGLTLVRLLQNIRDDLRGLDDIGSDRDIGRERARRERARERQRERERERDRGERTESFILINSNDEAIILQGTFGPDDNQEDLSNTRTGVSFGDYFLGPSFDLLLQRLAESDLNCSGTPPAKKEAIAALPTVNIQETLGCTVCLEDFEMGTEAKAMPCQHKFHSHCILPWLEIHSSCPVCRFQLPTEESRNPCELADGGGTVSTDGDNAESSSSNREDTNHDGGSEPASPIFSALSAFFASPSSSPSSESSSPSSDENISHGSES